MNTLIHHQKLAKKALTKVWDESKEHDFLYFLLFAKWICGLKKIAFQFRLMTFILTVLWEFEFVLPIHHELALLLNEQRNWFGRQFAREQFPQEMKTEKSLQKYVCLLSIEIEHLCEKLAITDSSLEHYDNKLDWIRLN